MKHFYLVSMLSILLISCSKYNYGEIGIPQLDLQAGFLPGYGSIVPSDSNDPDSVNTLFTNRDPAMMRMACPGEAVFEYQVGFSLFWTEVSAPCVNGIVEFPFPALGAGEHDVKIRLRKGKVISTPVEFKLNIDQTTPANPPISSTVVNTSIYSGNLTSYPLAGTCTEKDSSVLIKITDVNGNIHEVTPIPKCREDGTWSTSVDLSGLADGDLNLSVEIRDLAGNIATPQIATLIKDTAPRTIFATTLSQVFTEGAGTFNFRFELSSAFEFPTTFNLAYTANTTFDETQEDFNNATFTIPAGSSFIDIPVVVTDNNIYDANKTFEVQLTSSAHAAIDDTRKVHAVTVVNDDALPAARLQLSTLSVPEASASGSFTVELTSTRSAYPVTVPFTVTDIDGGVGKLSGFTSGNLIIPANATSASASFNLIADNDVNEGNKTFRVTLGTPLDNQGHTLSAVAPSALDVTIVDDDTPPVVSFDTASGTLSETVSNFSFNYSVSRAFSQPITVNFSLSGSASRNNDYLDNSNNPIASNSFAVTIPAMTTSGSYTVSLVNDSNDENDETVILSMTSVSSPNGTPILGAITSETLTISDDEANPVITLSGEGEFSEATGAVTLTATLSHPSELSINALYVVDYQTSSSFDHDALNGSLTFDPMETSKTITINLTNDTMDEPDETFSINLAGSPTNASYPVVNSPSVLTIQDNDSAPTVQISSSGTSFTEASGSFTLVLTMSDPSGYPITVPVSRSGTALNPADYTMSATSFTIPATLGNPAAGIVSNTITTNVIEDTTFDVSKSLRFDLDAASHVSIHPTLNNISVTISENDAQPRPKFEQSTYQVTEGDGSGNFNIQLATSTSDMAITVPYTVSDVSGGTAKLSGFGNGSVVIPAGSSSANVVFNLVTENDINDGDKVFRVTLGSATTSGGQTLTNISPTQMDVTIKDNDTPPVITFTSSSATVDETAGQYTFNIQTNRPYSQAITLNMTLAGSAVRNTDYMSSTNTSIPAASFAVTIPSNASSLTYVVTVTDDNIDENSETISLTLNSASSSIGSPTIGGTSVHTLTIADNEVAPTLILTAASPVAENSGTNNVVASLSHPSSFAVSSAYTITQATASSFDHNGASGTVSFSAQETTKNIPITITSDTMDEPDETFTIALSGSCTNCSHASPNVTSTITITDDDAPPTVTLSASSLSVEEWTSGAVTLTMTMSGPSGWPVSVPLTVAGTAISGSDFNLSGTTFLIAATTGNPAGGLTTAAQTLTMIDDTALEPAETIELTLPSTSYTSQGSPATRTINIGATNAPNLIAQTAPTNWGTSNVSRTRDYIFRNTGNETSGTISSFVLSSAHPGYTLGTNNCTSATLNPYASHSVECTVKVNFDYSIRGSYTANWAISEPRSNSLSGAISASMDFSWNYYTESFDAPVSGNYLGSYSPNGSYSGTCEQRGWSAYTPAWQETSYNDCSGREVYGPYTTNCYVQVTTYDQCGWCWSGGSYGYSCSCPSTRTEVGGSIQYYQWSEYNIRYACGSSGGTSRYQSGNWGDNYKYWCSDSQAGVPGAYGPSCGGCYYNKYQYTSNYSCY